MFYAHLIGIAEALVIHRGMYTVDEPRGLQKFPSQSWDPGSQRFILRFRFQDPPTRTTIVSLPLPNHQYSYAYHPDIRNTC